MYPMHFVSCWFFCGLKYFLAQLLKVYCFLIPQLIDDFYLLWFSILLCYWEILIIKNWTVYSTDPIDELLIKSQKHNVIRLFGRKLFVLLLSHIPGSLQIMEWKCILWKARKMYRNKAFETSLNWNIFSFNIIVCFLNFAIAQELVSSRISIFNQTWRVL